MYTIPQLSHVMCYRLSFTDVSSYPLHSCAYLQLHQAVYTLVLFPDPTPTRGKGSGVLRAISWASRMQNSHVILIIVMATHCLVHGPWYAGRTCNNTGLICTAGALSHEKSHAVNLIGAPEIRTATSSSPRNRSKYTRPSSPCRGGVWDRDYVYMYLTQTLNLSPL